MAKRIPSILALLILMAPALCLADLSSNLIAFYPFNGNAFDESGRGHHGVLINGACLTEDRFGNPNSAAGFDGVNDYIQTWRPTGRCSFHSEKPITTSMKGIITSQ
jgi:hypothetical protein